ncbi:MAG: GNAT family N-acetyltransferase [Candidatus Dormibacteria bacterium]
MIGPGKATLRSGPSSPAELLALHDQQLRSPSAFLNTPGAVVEEVGPVLRVSWPGAGRMVLLRADRAVGEEELTRLISQQVAHFSARGEPFEWKTFAHDQPLESPLLRLGFRRGPEETVMVGVAAALPASPLPRGVTVRRASSDTDFERLARQQSVAFGKDETAIVRDTKAAVLANPDAVVVLLAEAEGELVGSARAEFVGGTEFCTLWAGSTAPGWRHRGLYRALVAARADLGLRRGHRLLEVEALPTSRPILEQLGFLAVTASTPFTWEPPPG